MFREYLEHANCIFFSDIFFPEISGISDSIIATGHELRRRGHEICYIVPEYSKKDYLLLNSELAEKCAIGDHRRTLPIHRLPSLSFPGSPTGQWRFSVPHGASLRRLRKFDPDIIHTQTPFGTGFEALLASQVFQAPLIGTNHTPIEQFVRYVPFLDDKLAKIAGRFSARYYNHCIYLTAPNNKLIDDMRRMKFARPAQPLPNPVLIDAFKAPSAQEKSETKKSLGLSGPLIIYAGRLAAEKHVDVILRAVARLPPKAPITLIITGHGKAENGLRALARELNLGEHVQFTGFVSSDRLVKLYRAADIFVMMSTAESQSLALMQGFASGLPAVVARAQGLTEHTSADCSFPIEPGDENALSNRLKQLLDDENLRAQMGAAGAKFAQRYAPEIIAEKWEQIYVRFRKQRD